MIGTALNQYRITATIGAGGMGEVFRARDTRLNRDVAVKVLPKDFVADADRLRRFEQEAKTLAALNHPNVLTVFDAGVHEGAPYLVSELLEGKTLREEMNGGALPVRKATEYALQIAHGLAAAHGKGVIHRDLKPENIFVTKDGRVKILDFGLAKLRNPSPDLRPPSPLGGARDGVRGESDVPTIRIDADAIVNTTEPGMVLGTPAYMAPEQVRGEPADHRADIFAFGCVLYEMLSGARAFRRNTPVESMNAVLSEEPPELSVSNPNLSPSLDRLVRRCLEKLPERRFQTASDLAFALENAGSGSTPFLAGTPGDRGTGRVRWMRFLPWAVTALLALALLFVIASPIRIKVGEVSRPALTGPLNKFQLHLPGSEFVLGKSGVQAAISPDGRKLAYVNEEGLWLYRLDQVSAAKQLVSDRNITAPFWSPDSSDIGYFNGERFYRTTVDGARPILLCHQPNPSSPNGAGGAWMTTGRIILSAGNTPLLEISAASGGQPSVALPLDEGERGFEEPSGLPGGRGVLFVVKRNDRDGETIAVRTPDGKRKNLLRISGGTVQSPVYSSSGHVIYWRLDGEYEGIWAFEFSMDGLERTGEPFQVSGDGKVPSASNTGTLAFSLNESAFFGPRQLTWVDRSGRILGTLGKPIKGLTMQHVSPDGRQAVAISRESTGVTSIWLFDAAHGSAIPFSSTNGNYFYNTANWSTDGLRVIFMRNRRGEGYSIAAKASDGSGEEQILFEKTLGLISSSGNYLMVPNWEGGSGTNGYIRVSDPDKKIIPFPEAFQRIGRQYRLSPDDRLFAYTMGEFDQTETYVVEFPSFKNRRLVSRGGGRYPEWHPNGQELFFLGENRRAMMSARLKPGTSDFEAPVKLFEILASIYNDQAASIYDVAPDGRFLMLQKVEDASYGAGPGKPNVQIVLNWFEEFRERK